MDILLVSFFNSGQTLEIVKAPLSLALKVRLTKKCRKTGKSCIFVAQWHTFAINP